MFENYPDVVSVKQMQEMLCISKNVAYSLIKDGRISTVKIGRVYKIPKKNIVKFIDNHIDK